MAATNEPVVEISEEDGCTNLVVDTPGLEDKIRVQISPTGKLEIFREQSNSNNNNITVKFKSSILHVRQPAKLHTTRTVVEDQKVNGGVEAKKVIAKLITVNLTIGSRRSCNGNKKRSFLKKKGIQILWVVFILGILHLTAKWVGEDVCVGGESHK